jgi:hypothetical protein
MAAPVVSSARSQWTPALGALSSWLGHGYGANTMTVSRTMNRMGPGPAKGATRTSASAADSASPLGEQRPRRIANEGSMSTPAMRIRRMAPGRVAATRGRPVRRDWQSPVRPLGSTALLRRVPVRSRTAMRCRSITRAATGSGSVGVRLLQAHSLNDPPPPPRSWDSRGFFPSDMTRHAGSPCARPEPCRSGDPGPQAFASPALARPARTRSCPEASEARAE